MRALGLRAGRALGGQEPAPLSGLRGGEWALARGLPKADRGDSGFGGSRELQKSQGEIPGHQLPRKLARSHSQDGRELRAKMALIERRDARDAPHGLRGDTRATPAAGRKIGRAHV